MLTATRKHTVEDYLKLEEGDPYQLLNGDLIRSPAPNIRHQETLAWLLTQLFTGMQQRQLGKIFCAPTDVNFDEENVLQPDILFISNARLDIIKEDGVHGPPDLIIEIISPSSGYYDTKIKKNLYEYHGVREYWTVDPADNEVIGFRLEEGKYSEFYKGVGELHSEILNLTISFIQ